MKKFSIRTSRLLAGAAMAAALFAACTADTEDVPVAAVPLRFSVSMPEGWDDLDAARSAADKTLPTRATPFMGDSFGVFAYVKGSPSESPILYMNVEVKRREDGSYAPDENYYLRDGMETIFFAYYPYSDDVKDSKQIICNVVDNNKDWLTAVTSVSATNEFDDGIALTFSHACASVTLTSYNHLSDKIALSEAVFTTGTLAPDITNSKWKWSPISTAPKFENKSLAISYYMIPQPFSVPPKATLTSFPNAVSIPGLSEWKENTAYTYYFD